MNAFWSLVRVAFFTCAAVWAMLSTHAAYPFGVARSALRAAANHHQLSTEISRAGGVLIDFVSNDFISQATGGGVATRYVDYPTMFTALSGAHTSSAKLCYNASGVLTQFAANTPAAPCYSGAETLRGLVMESAAVNVLLQSSTFSNASWSKVNGSIVANNRLSPLATLTASTFTEDGTNGEHSLVQTIAKSATALTYTASCHVAAGAGERNAFLRVDDGAGNGAAAVFAIDRTADKPVPSGIGTPFTTLATWADPAGASDHLRIALTATTNSATTIRFTVGLASDMSLSYSGDGNSGMAVWGCQLEQGTVGVAQTATSPSSHIPTTTASVSRLRDISSLTLPVAMRGQSAYSVVLDATLPRANSGQITALMSLADSSDTNYLALLQSTPATGDPFAQRIVDGATTVTVATPGPLGVFDQAMGVAAVFNAGNYWIENSGQGVKTSTATTYPSTALTKLRFNSYSTIGTVSGNVGTRRLGIFPVAVPTATLQSLLFPLPPLNLDAVGPTNYFTEAMLANVVLPHTQVFYGTSPPAHDGVSAAQYPYFPLNIAVSPSIAKSAPSTSTGVKFAYQPWGNRCDLCAESQVHAPNGTGGPGFFTSTGKVVRFSFSTYDLADAATLTQLLYAMGYPAHAGGPCPAGQIYCGYLDAANDAGIADADVLPRAAVVANPDAYATVPNGVYMTMIDRVLLPDGVVPAMTMPAFGVDCDCEWADNRLASRTTRLVTQMALIVHNAGPYKLVISVNDLLAAGQAGGLCGVGIVRPNCDEENLNTIANIVDGIMIAASRPPPKGFTFNEALQAHWDLFGTPGTFPASALILQFTMGIWPGGTLPGDADAAYAFVALKGYGGVSFIPAGAAPGGSLCRPSNIKRAKLLGLSTAGC